MCHFPTASSKLAHLI